MLSVEEFGICHVVRHLSSDSWVGLEGVVALAVSEGVALTTWVIWQWRWLGHEVGGGQVDRVGVVGEDVRGELVVAWRVGHA